MLGVSALLLLPAPLPLAIGALLVAVEVVLPLLSGASTCIGLMRFLPSGPLLLVLLTVLLTVLTAAASAGRLLPTTAPLLPPAAAVLAAAAAAAVAAAVAAAAAAVAALAAGELPVLAVSSDGTVSGDVDLAVAETVEVAGAEPLVICTGAATAGC
jgi:hypothetical protein